MQAKQRAGEEAAQFIEDNMILGLGTGTTVYWVLRKIASLIDEGMTLRGIPTSLQTENQAREFGVPLTDLAQVDSIDLTIDGADEVSPALDLIKGGGGALFREKVIAKASRRMIVVAEKRKCVDALGAFLIPVEVVPFALDYVKREVEVLGGSARLREKDGEIFISDNGNHIVDCDFGIIDDPKEIDTTLKLVTGVIETGLFVGIADTAIVGSDDGVEILRRRKV